MAKKRMPKGATLAMETAYNRLKQLLQQHGKQNPDAIENVLIAPHYKTVVVSLPPRLRNHNVGVAITTMSEDAARLLRATSELVLLTMLNEVRADEGNMQYGILRIEDAALNRLANFTMNPRTCFDALLTGIAKGTRPSIVSEEVWGPFWAMKTESEAMPIWSYASHILVHSTRTMVTNFKECLKPKSFWKIVFKYCRARLRMINHANGERECERGYEKRGAKVAYEICMEAQRSFDNRNRDINLRGLFQPDQMHAAHGLLEHMHGLLAPLVYAIHTRETWTTCTAAYRASYHANNKHLLFVILVHINRFFQQNGAPVREIYARNDISDEHKRDLCIQLPYWIQRMPGSFKVLPLSCVRADAYLDFTRTTLNDMVSAGLLQQHFAAQDSFWPMMLLDLEKNTFLKYQRRWSGERAQDRPRRARQLPFIAKNMHEFRTSLNERPGHPLWLINNLRVNRRELHLTLMRWTINDMTLARQLGIYTPLPGTRAVSVGVLPELVFSTADEIPDKGLYNHIMHDGADSCPPFPAAAVDLGRKNFVAIKRRHLERRTANGAFDFADVEDLSQWRACETTRFYQELPSSNLLQHLEQQRMANAEYAAQHQQLAETQSRTTHVPEVLHYLSLREQRFTHFGEEIFSPLSASLRFRSCQERQIALAKLAKEMAQDVKLLFVGGADVNAGCTRGHRKVPQKALLSALSRETCVVIFDEAYTSSRCSVCRSDRRTRTVYATEASLASARERLHNAQRAQTHLERANGPAAPVGRALMLARQRTQLAQLHLDAVSRAVPWYRTYMQNRQRQHRRQMRGRRGRPPSLLSPATSDTRVECCEICRYLALHDELSTDNDLDIMKDQLSGRPRAQHLSPPADMRHIT